MCIIGLQYELEEEEALSTAEDDYDDDADEDGIDYREIKWGNVFFLSKEQTALMFSHHIQQPCVNEGRFAFPDAYIYLFLVPQHT